MFESRCGLKCSECEYRVSMNCPGCPHMDKPFWGDACDVKSCCESKGHDHCGQCSQLPCDTLNQFAYAEQEGDNGKRIENCRSWANHESHGISK